VSSPALVFTLPRVGPWCKSVLPLLWRYRMLERLEERFRHLAPQGDFCSLRFVRERSEVLAVRQNIVQPMETSEDSGAMLTVYAGDGMGYAATGDVSLSGLQRAAEQARG